MHVQWVYVHVLEYIVCTHCSHYVLLLHVLILMSSQHLHPEIVNTHHVKCSSASTNIVLFAVVDRPHKPVYTMR